MAPAAKRRKRTTIVDDSDELDDYSTDQQPKKAKNTSNTNSTPTKNNNYDKNTIQRFLFSSPDANRQKQSPSPNKATSAAAGLEDDLLSASPTPFRKQRPATHITNAVVAKPPSFPSTAVSKSPSKSPIKARTRASRKAAEQKKDSNEKKHEDLRTLFSRQAQSQVVRPKKKKEAQILEDIISDPIVEDDIEDSDDDIPLARSSGQASFVGKAAAAKQQRNGLRSGSGSFVGSSSSQGKSAGVGGLFGSSQSKLGGGKFLLKRQQSPPPPPTQSQAIMKPLHEKDARPWSDRFAPVNLEELAVHKKKVADVRRWLEDVYGGRLRQRLLILKGHAGTGKTTTIQLLAKDLRCEVLEWRNPVNNFVGGQAYQSAATQFEDFLGRGGKFGQLDVEGDEKEEGEDMPPPPLPSSQPGNASLSEKKLILIEEFPNTFVRSSTALVAFRNSILQYLAANMPSGIMGWGRAASSEPITPVVMVISETLLTTASASADSFTAHRLLGPEILRHPGTAVIEFNPVAPTLLAKALEVIVQKEARRSGRRRTPGPLVLQRLGEIGDIRSAISSLEFLCVKGDDDTDWGSKVSFTKSKRSKDTPTLTKGEQESLELISRREATLGIFHAVGKVVYNKREGLKPAAEVLPSHLAHLSRPIPSQVSVDTLMDETGTDTHTFISALHENYALSCEQTGPLDENSSLDYLNGCLDYLSESDLLCPSQDIFFGGKGYGGGFIGKDSGSHILRQDEMAFQVAVRGLLFSLPYPVKRQTHPKAGGGGSNAHKMYYPTYLKLWRAKEEIEGLTDLWSTKLLKNEDCGPGPSVASSQPHIGGFSAFRKQAGSQFSPAKQKMKAVHDDIHESPPPLSLGNVSRQELLLDRLPYMAQIARSQRSLGGMQRVKELDRIVAFSGIGPPGASEEDGEDADEDSGAAREAANSWATDRPTEEATPRKRRGLGAILHGRDSKKGEETGAEELQGVPIESLVISDDDIEDD